MDLVLPEILTKWTWTSNSRLTLMNYVNKHTSISEGFQTWNHLNQQQSAWYAVANEYDNQIELTEIMKEYAIIIIMTVHNFELKI